LHNNSGNYAVPRQLMKNITEMGEKGPGVGFTGKKWLGREMWMVLSSKNRIIEKLIFGVVVKMNVGRGTSVSSSLPIFSQQA